MNVVSILLNYRDGRPQIYVEVVLYFGVGYKIRGVLWVHMKGLRWLLVVC